MSDYPKTQRDAIRYLNMPKPVEEGRFRSVFAVLTDVFDGVVRYQALTTARKTIQDAEARLNWLEEERRQLAGQVKDLEGVVAAYRAACEGVSAAQIDGEPLEAFLGALLHNVPVFLNLLAGNRLNTDGNTAIVHLDQLRKALERDAEAVVRAIENVRHVIEWADAVDDVSEEA